MPEILPAIYSKIARGVYVGNYPSACNKSILSNLGITHIIIAAEELEVQFPDEFDYLRLPIRDTLFFDIKQYLKQAVFFIDSARNKKGTVLVHCYAGMSRSVTIVMAYLMHKKRLTVVKALAQVKSKHKMSRPNLGFLKQLSEMSDRNTLDLNIACRCSLL